MSEQNSRERLMYRLLQSILADSSASYMHAAIRLTLAEVDRQQLDSSHQLGDGNSHMKHCPGYAPSPAAASGVPLEVGMIEQFCRDLNDAHNEILRLQGVQPEDYSKYDWPEWSAPANSIRWAERVLGKPLSKTSLRSSPLPAEAQEPWQFAREQFIEAARRIEEQCISHSIADMLRDAARHAPSDTKGR
jgi:hypothetical protein